MTAGRLGIIAMPGRKWSDLYMTASNTLLRLARDHDVVWIAPAHDWRSIPSRAFDGTSRFSRPVEGSDLTVYTPPALLPNVYRSAPLSRLVMSRWLCSARRHLVERGCTRIVLYLWRPEYVDALDLVDHDVSVYHIVDEYSFSAADPPTPATEARLIASVDHLIVHSPALLVKKGATRPTEFIPNGVDFEAFANPGPEPADLAGIPRPRIGYCGYLKRQMDWRLLGSLIERRPDLSWVFVGKLHHPDLESTIKELDRRPNVFFLGEKSSHELSRYPAHFDVSIMPYVSDGYTRYIFPLKLHEYLAAGRPTIGTPIRSVVDFESVVQIADGVDEWSSALDLALSESENSAERVAERQAVAKANDWDALTKRIEELLLEL